MRGQYDKAVAAYDEALTAPEIADFIKASIYSDRGVAKWRMNQTKDAIDAYLELKMEEVERFEMMPHPIEFDMYYSV